MKPREILSITLTICIVTIFASGCTKSKIDTSALYIPTSSDVTTYASLAELQQGRELYINYCSSCHDLYSPDQFTVVQWKSNLNSMTPKTSLNSSDISLVTKYVTRGKP
jgi:hypothetical protein